MTAPAPSIFSAQDVAELRAVKEGFMTAECAVQDAVTVETEGGGEATAYVTVAGREAEPCSFTPEAGPTESIAADQVTAAARYLVEFRHGTTVSSRQRLVLTWTDRTGPHTMTLDVAGDQPKSLEFSRRVLATRVGG